MQKRYHIECYARKSPASQNGKKHAGNGVASLAKRGVSESRETKEMLNVVGMCLAKVNEKLVIVSWRFSFHAFRRGNLGRVLQSRGSKWFPNGFQMVKNMSKWLNISISRRR